MYVILEFTFPNYIEVKKSPFDKGILLTQKDVYNYLLNRGYSLGHIGAYCGKDVGYQKIWVDKLNPSNEFKKYIHINVSSDTGNLFLINLNFTDKEIIESFQDKYADDLLKKLSEVIRPYLREKTINDILCS